MHRLWFYALFAAPLVLPLVGCGGSGSGGIDTQDFPSRRVALDQEFTLRVGQEAQLGAEGLTVVVRAVPEDSRCPEDAQCVWEGNARVQVELTKAGQSGAVVDLNTSPRIGAETAAYLNYTVQLVSLAPNPRSNRLVASGDYVIGLRVSKQ